MRDYALDAGAGCIRDMFITADGHLVCKTAPLLVTAGGNSFFKSKLDGAGPRYRGHRGEEN